jgi:hypothetical protein
MIFSGAQDKPMRGIIMKRFAAFLITLLVLALACSLTPNNQNAQQDNNGLTSEEIVETASAATLTAIAEGEQQPGDTPAPPEGDTPVPQPSDTPQPNCQPLHPGAQTLDLPVGVALADGSNNEVINFYNLQGSLIGSKTLSGLPWVDINQVHLAGGNTAGFPNLPIVYHAMIPGSELLRLNINNAISDLGSAPQLVALTGAETQDFVAYTLNTTGPSGWISYLYASGYAGVTSTPPLLTRDQGDGYVIYPLAVHQTAGTSPGILYTESLYGIGNINFAPYRGLYYYDVLSGATTSFLPPDATVAGLSPDQTWVAYTPGTGSSPGQAAGSITIKNLITCEEVTLAFDQPTNLGGWVEFSPDNSYIAWLETFGPNPMEATFRVRVAAIDGTSLVNAELSTLSSLLGGVVPEYVMPPMKWVDNHVLGINLRPTGSPNAVFVIWAPDPAQPLDPALGANQSTALGNGRFIGLLYP